MTKALMRPEQGSWRETSLAVVTASLMLLVMVQPAFHAYFFGENFLYLGQYIGHNHDYLRSAFSPINGIFFRPLSFAVSAPWYFILPPDPWYYHLVNFSATVIVLVLLHRVLLWLVASRIARLLALTFFAISKIHLTTIGYINLLESPVTLLLLLLTVLLLLRYAASRHWQDYAAGLCCCGLSMFVKDYGIVVVIIAVALMLFIAMQPSDWRFGWRYWGLRAAPFVPMVLTYLAIRHAVVASQPAGNAVYAPQISLDIVVRKGLVFVMTLPNLSLIDNGTTGAMGLGALVGPYIPVAMRSVSVVDGALGIAFLLLGILTCIYARPSGWRWMFPAIWIAAYWGPTLLVRNVQMYYMYEALAGVAILLGMCLDGARRHLRQAWLVAVVVIAVNGIVSNYRSLYYWQRTANAAQEVSRAVLQRYSGQPLDAITFVTAAPAFWQFALTADGKGPLLPTLLGRPALEVQVVDFGEAAARNQLADSTHVVLELDNGIEPLSR